MLNTNKELFTTASEAYWWTEGYFGFSIGQELSANTIILFSEKKNMMKNNVIHSPQCKLYCYETDLIYFLKKLYKLNLTEQLYRQIEEDF